MSICGPREPNWLAAAVVCGTEMDLGTVEDLVTGRCRRTGPGDAWLAGGTWLFSEPQPGLRRLLDLNSLDWPALHQARTSW